MLKIYQHTLSKPIFLKGQGLHTGRSCAIKILPAEADQGIIFKRTDLDKNNLIKANYKNVSSAKLCTTLENKFGVKVSTVEHLLASFYISGIDNVIVEIDNEEVPIMDGSAVVFVNEIQKQNLKELAKKRKYLKILKKVNLEDGEKKISIEKGNSSLEVQFNLNYKNKIIDKQKNKIDFQNDDLEDVINSRTFCLYEDIEKIKKLGLAKGGSLENALVINEDKILNKEGLRNEKEFVNHKILDFIGDIYLSGYKVIAKIKCKQGGHKLTNQLLRRVFEDNSNFSIIEIKEKNLPHTFINRNFLKSIA